MIELHFQGIKYDLHEDQSAADITKYLNEYTKHNGSAMLKLADGRFLHLQVGKQPVYALVIPRNYREEQSRRRDADND